MESLSLAKTSITDSGMRALPTLRKLKRLNISGTGVGDNCLAELSRFDQLEELVVGHTFSDDGRNRRRFNAADISDRGVAYLTKVLRLRDLNLRGTNVTDNGLKPLKDLPHLESLDLIETGITDTGLAHLISFPGLRVLKLVEEIPVIYPAEGPITKTLVTEGGVERLQKRRQDIEILYFPPMNREVLPSARE